MQTIQASATTLFHVAARYLNDATQWIRIAQQNGLSDPNIGGVTTLVIPDVNPAAGGGIVVQ